MQNLELSFASKDTSFSVRSFSIDQRLGAPFEIDIVALSALDDADLEAFIGLGATLRLGATDLFGLSRSWTGIVSHMEQVEAESTGLSTYFLRIVPELWRTTRRRNNRIFQHLSSPEIATKLLGEWQILPKLVLDPTGHPASEYRVQYGESDFAFLSRLLEDAGITYWFVDPSATPDPKNPASLQTSLVLGDEPQRSETRPQSLAFFNGKDLYADRESITAVKIIEDVRAGRVTIRDYDFRSRPDFQLISEAKNAIGLENKLELYDYAPGAFMVEPQGQAARFDEREARALAERRLAGERQGRRRISYRVNVLDLTPSNVFTIDGHPRHDLSKRRLLVTRQTIVGTRDAEWKVTGEAVFADDVYRPMLVTPKPRIAGVQSALIVGPAGEEIHTDEYGRVRVQFHWDREGERDEKSSCWIRVSQPWAGHGFGMVAIPRVGEEVLVGFYDGDPDQPVIVGRVFNSAARIPIKLPAMKTRSSWKTDSSPGSGGYNEISLDDAKGSELVLFHAERDLERTVKNDERVQIGASLSTSIGQSEDHQVKEHQSIHVSGNHSLVVDGASETTAGESWSLKLGADAGIVYKEKRIVFTTGQASIVLDGPHIYLDGAASIRLSSGDATTISGSEVHIAGGPNVYVNASPAQSPSPSMMSGVPYDHAIASLPEEAEHEAQFESLVSNLVSEPDGAPSAIMSPAFVDKQLTLARQAVLDKGEEIVDTIKGKVDDIKAKAIELGENLVPKVEAARREAYAAIDALRGKIEAVKAEANARIKALEAQAQTIKQEIMADVALVKGDIAAAEQRVNDIVAQIKERVAEIRQEARDMVARLKQTIKDVKAQAKAAFDALRKDAMQAINAAKAIVDQVKATIAQLRQSWKDIVSQVKQTIENAKEQIKQTIQNVKNQIQAVKQQIKQALAEAKGDLKQLKTDFNNAKNEVKNEIKDAKNQVKQIGQEVKSDVKQAEQEAKADINQAKQEAKQDLNQAKQDFNQAKQEAKQDLKQAKQDLKEGEQEAKQDLKQAKQDLKQGEQEAKAAVQQGKQDLKQGEQEAKAAVQQGKQDLKQGEQQAKAAVQQGKQDLKQAGQEAKSGLDDAKNEAKKDTQGTFKKAGHLNGGAHQSFPEASSLNGARGGLAGSPMVTRAGGFGGEGVAHAVNGSKGATFLQSPTEGQLMVLRTKTSMPIAPADLSREVVDHQMNGVPSSDAFAGALSNRGYAVYERPWDSTGGEFVKKAFL